MVDPVGLVFFFLFFFWGKERKNENSTRKQSSTQKCLQFFFTIHPFFIWPPLIIKSSLRFHWKTIVFTHAELSLMSKTDTGKLACSSHVSTVLRFPLSLSDRSLQCVHGSFLSGVLSALVIDSCSLRLSIDSSASQAPHPITGCCSLMSRGGWPGVPVGWVGVELGRTPVVGTSVSEDGTY